jgi:tRNA nucleotidyltransferase (CCA-adding enzyme)
MKMYEVGGCVRDEILGVPSKDIDFTVVMEPGDEVLSTDPFRAMVTWLKTVNGFKIFLETPEYLTVRAQTPKSWFVTDRPTTADFVLARKESDYTDGRRPDTVAPGTLEDDLARRDFTMNAIAKASDGSYIDPFNGRDDIRDAVIRAVGDPMERLTEDALRALRALRFSVTKKIKWPCYWKSFEIEESLAEAMESEEVIDSILDNISDERIQVELSKMFRYDTRGSLDALEQFPYLRDAVFSGSVSLDATMKLKGRGK